MQSGKFSELWENFAYSAGSSQNFPKMFAKFPSFDGKFLRSLIFEFLIKFMTTLSQTMLYKGLGLKFFCDYQDCSLIVNFQRKNRQKPVKSQKLPRLTIWVIQKCNLFLQKSI